MLIRALRYAVNSIWAVAIIALLLFTVYVSLGRVMMPQLHQYQTQLEDYLSETTGLMVGIGQLQGHWQNLQPQLTLNDVILIGADGATIELRELSLQLDVFNSLAEKQPVFTRAGVSGVSVNLVHNAAGQWSIPGFTIDSKATDSDSSNLLDLVNLLWSQGHLSLTGIMLHIRSEQDDLPRSLAIDNLDFQCAGQHCAIETVLSLHSESETTLTAAANFSGQPGTEAFSASGYAELSPALPLEQWLPLLPLQLPVDINVSRLHAGGELWFEWQQGRLVDARGTASIPRIRYQSAATDQLEYAVQADWVWQADREHPGQWQLWVDQLRLDWEQAMTPPAQQLWYVSQEPSGKYLNLLAGSIDLHILAHTIMSIEQTPARVKDIVSQLDPQGLLNDVYLRYRLDGELPMNQRFQVEASMAGVGASAFDGAPTFSGMDGYLRVTADGGWVSFASQNLALHFPKLYRNGWQFDQASGALGWSVINNKQLNLHSSLIHLQNEHSNVHGQFNFIGSTPDTEPRLNILLGLEDSDARQVLSFAPDKRVNPELLAWLDQGIKGGRIEQAQFALGVNTKKNAPEHSQNLRLNVQTRDIDIAYADGWPLLEEVNARVQVKGEQAWISGQQARLRSSQITAIEAVLTPDGKRLDIKGQLDGPATDGLYLLQQSPLRARLFEQIDDFSMSGGTLAGDIALSVSVTDGNDNRDDVEAEIDLVLKEVDVQMASLDLQFNQVTGPLSYSSARGVSSPGLDLQFFNQRAELRVNSEIAGDRLKTQLELDGAMPAAAFHDWQPSPLQSQVTGQADYQAVLSVGGENPLTLMVNSDLKGMSVALPGGLKKAPQDLRALKFELQGGDESLTYRIEYGEELTAIFVQPQQDDTTLLTGVFHFGEGLPALPKDTGIEVSGTLATADLDEWLELLDILSPPGADDTADTSLGVMRSVDVNIEQAHAFEQIITALHFTAQPVAGGWQLGVASELVAGDITVSTSDQPHIIDLQYLRLLAADAEESDALQHIDPGTLPAAQVSVGEFSIGDDNYGRWHFSVAATDQGAQFSAVDLDINKLQVQGDLNWRYDPEGGHSTNYRGRMVSKDIAKTLEAFDYHPSVQSKEVSFDAEIGWAGSPAALDIVQASISGELSAGKGRFVDLQQGGGLLRIFGVLNVGSVTRRLSLDFSDLYKKGFSFDKIAGKVELQQGVLRVPRVDVNRRAVGQI